MENVFLTPRLELELQSASSEMICLTLVHPEMWLLRVSEQKLESIQQVN